MGRYRLCMLVLAASIAGCGLSCGTAPPATPHASTGAGASGTTGSGSTGTGSGPGTITNPAANTLTDIHQHSGWNGYALLPSAYTICSSCSPTGPQATWSIIQDVSSPSVSGNSTEFDIGGQTPFGDILWNKHLIGDLSSEGLADKNQTINPGAHNFTYEVSFYGTDLTASQALEFDINQFVGSQSFIWGHECRIAGGHEWDVWDDQSGHWHPTGVACNPVSQAWNHLILQVQRTADNQLVFESISLNGVSTPINYTTSPTATTWYGVTVNYQMDGNVQPVAYSVWLDNFNFTYW